MFREAAGGHFVGATLPEDVGWLPSGDLFIAFPALDGFVPTSRWECLHNTGRQTPQLNPGFDMPQPPDCSCWRFFRQAEFLLQARQLHQPEAERAAGNLLSDRTIALAVAPGETGGDSLGWRSCVLCGLNDRPSQLASLPGWEHEQKKTGHWAA